MAHHWCTELEIRCRQLQKRLSAPRTKAVSIEFGKGVEGETEAILGGGEADVAKEGRHQNTLLAF